MRTRRSAARARRAGFTILEVLVALAILAFGLTVVIGLLTFGAALTRTAQLRASAATCAEAVTADLEAGLFPWRDGEAGEPLEIRDQPVGAVPGLVYSATATPNPRRANEYRVDVDMRWHSAGVQREKRFSVILLREIPFGERLRRQFVERGTEAAPAAPEPAPPDGNR